MASAALIQDTLDVLAESIRDRYPGRIALISSFGAESAVLLDLAARVDASIPVIFLNTGKLFGETLRYRDLLAKRLGLSDIRDMVPEPAALKADDPDEILWSQQPDRCCHIRKVLPLERGLALFDAWITGRKRFHGAARSGLSVYDPTSDGRMRINPLVGWSKADMDAYFEARDLPRHSLEADGYLSIGCMPCTDRVAPGENVRDGRWRGQGKTECGIHLAPIPRAAGAGRA